jgi:SOS-response transcriptional repressor LexA
MYNFSLNEEPARDYLSHMNAEWFKKRQKMAGVTGADIAEALNRDRTVVSHIYHGRQKMSLDQAKKFSEVLKAPLSEVLLNAGIASKETVQELNPGFAESDVAAWVPKPEGDKGPDIEAMARALGGGRNGIDIWQVKSRAMALAGYLEGDYMLVDTGQRDTCKAGDVVLAQVYDFNAGAATTILRRYQTPVLLAASADPAEWGVHVVDHNAVVIMGKVVGSWRV